jgi:hypothetical protein
LAGSRPGSGKNVDLEDPTQAIALRELNSADAAFVSASARNAIVAASELKFGAKPKMAPGEGLAALRTAAVRSV